MEKLESVLVSAPQLWERFTLVHLRGEDGVPLACFILDGARLGSPFELPVEFELDAPDLGETYSVVMSE
jgi:hypothetical protein